MKKINFLIKITIVFFLFCVTALNAQSQSKTIDGIVDDGYHLPLPGVNIVVKGTTNGAVTDLDGKFSIKVSESSRILVFSYLGFITVEKVIGESSTINVTLKEDTQALDEVIVIGYGQVKKGDATGAVTTVSAKDFNRGAISSPQELITGKIAGVNITAPSGQPGGEMKIRIRGGASLTASNDPLYIIDGIPLDGSGIDGMTNILSFINPSDIETFTVLKDASATAIYGLRATNGVILITTKKGKKGKMLITYDSKLSISKVLKTVESLSASEFITMVKSGEAKGILGKGASAKLGTANTVWQDEIFQTAFSHVHNLGISGSSYNIPYRFSGAFSDQEGILKTSAMKRYTGSLSLTPTFFDNHISVGVNLRATKIENRFADKGAIGGAIRMDPTKPVYNKTGLFGGYYAWKSNDNTPNALATRNPLAQLLQKNDGSDVYRYIADAKIEYKVHFIDGLKLTAKVAYDYAKSEGNILVDSKASWVQKGEDFTSKSYTQEKKNQLIDTYANYGLKLSEIKSTIDLTAGYSWQYLWSSKSEHQENSNTGIKVISPTEKWENYLIGFFGRLNYTFDNKYLLTASLRQDGSSRFSAEKDNQWHLFPAAAFAWKIFEEDFMKNIKSLSNLKLRLGYGVTGQQDIGSSVTDFYPYLASYVIGDNYSRYPLGDKYYRTQRPNGFDANIKWETTTTYNLGLDFGFFKNRINGSIDMYKRETKDLINYISIPMGSNFANNINTNIGNLENTGIEFTINAVAIASEDINWQLGFNIAYNKNEVTKLTKYDDPNYRGVETGGIMGATGNNIQRHVVGKPINTFYVYQQVYDNDGKPIEKLFVDRNKDGKSDVDDLYYAGTPAPDVTMGFTSNLTFYNFDFSIAGRVSLGNQVYDNVSSNNARYNNVYNLNFLSNLTKDINNSNFSGSSEVSMSDYYLHDASFFKLDNVTVGYNFTNFIKPYSASLISHLRLYASVQNVLTISEYDGLDPEIDNGIDNDFYPRPLTFLFGISVKF